MEVKEIQVSKILGTLCRMRLEYDYEKDELLESIREYGVLNPIRDFGHQVTTWESPPGT